MSSNDFRKDLRIRGSVHGDGPKYFLKEALSWVLVFAVAFAIAYSFYPIVKKLKKKGLSNGVAVAIVAGSIFLIFAILLVVTVPILYEQLVLLSQSIASIVSDIQTKFAVNLKDFKSTLDGLLNGLIGFFFVWFILLC